MEQVDRNEVMRLISRDNAQLVEVLPQRQYEEEHLAGAVNIPLKQLDRERSKSLDPNRPVIVYCNDFL